MTSVRSTKFVIHLGRNDLISVQSGLVKSSRDLREGSRSADFRVGFGYAQFAEINPSARCRQNQYAFLYLPRGHARREFKIEFSTHLFLARWICQVFYQLTLPVF